MRLLELLEGTNKKQLIQFCEQVERELRDCLPAWVGKLEVEHSSSFGGSITIRLALEPSRCWPHGIWRNSSHAIVTISAANDGAGDGQFFKLRVMTLRKLPKLHAKSGSLQQILSHLTRWTQQQEFQDRIRDIGVFLPDS